MRHLQYMLSILSDFIPSIPPVNIDGIFGPATRDAVVAAQRRFGLPETGQVDDRTWDEIYDQFSGIENTALRNGEVFPSARQTAPSTAAAVPAMAGNMTAMARSTTLTQYPGEVLRTGRQDPVIREVIR